MRCSAEGCTKSAQSPVPFCVVHGGGYRCQSESCMVYSDPKQRGHADRYKSPDGKYLCAYCFSCLYPELGRAKVRREHLVLAELQRLVPELGAPLVWDCRLPGQTCVDEKPDMFWIVHLPSGRKRGIGVEIDEMGFTHEDDDGRLARLEGAADVHEGFWVRICPDKILSPRQLPNGERGWFALSRFAAVMQEAADRVREAMRGEGDWKVRVGF